MNKAWLTIGSTRDKFWLKISFGAQILCFRNDKTFNLEDDTCYDWISKRHAISELSKFFIIYKQKNGRYKLKLKQGAYNVKVKSGRFWIGSSLKNYI